MTRPVRCLNPQEVVYLSGTLTIPAGASLRTCDAGDGTQTAKFGRLIRDAAFSGDLVETQGTIDRVWIDGQRGRLGYSPDDTNVEAMGGTVTNSRIAEPLGWTNLRTFEGSCGGTAPTITNNLITAYTSSHAIGGQWADGLSLSCSGTYATGFHLPTIPSTGLLALAYILRGMRPAM